MLTTHDGHITALTLPLSTLCSGELKRYHFLKISDPVKRDIIVKEYLDTKKNIPDKRDLIVKEYLDTKKNIRDNLFRERTGEQQLQTGLSKFFKPITETQKAITRDITEGVKPIKEVTENLPQAITCPAYPSIQAVEKLPYVGDKETVVAPYFTGVIAESYLRKFTTKGEADRTYGLYDKDGKFYTGNKPGEGVNCA